MDAAPQGSPPSQAPPGADSEADSLAADAVTRPVVAGGAAPAVAAGGAAPPAAAGGAAPADAAGGPAPAVAAGGPAPPDAHLTSGHAWLDRHVGPPMVGVAFLYLALMAGLLQSLRLMHSGHAPPAVLTWALMATWPLFFLELAAAWAVRPRGQAFWRLHWPRLLACFIPPLRLGSRSFTRPATIWLPFLGRQVVDVGLRERLERGVSFPMLGIALAILPLLALEYSLGDKLDETALLAQAASGAQVEIDWGQLGNPLAVHLGFAVDWGTSMIWLAFTLEFVVLLSVAESKLKYCRKNWIDLAVILLPLISFLRATRLLRLARLQQLTKMGRVYRLRGTALKVYEALVVLEVVRRWHRRKPEKRLARLRELCAEKELELAVMRQEIAELEQCIRDRTGSAAPADAPAPAVAAAPTPTAPVEA